MIGPRPLSRAARHHARRGRRARAVDRSTVMKLGMVAKQGALGASAAPRPGVKAGGVDPPLSEARSETARNGVMCSQRASQRRLIVGNRSSETQTTLVRSAA